MGSSTTREEITERFAEAFEIEVEATPNLIYKDGENFDTMIDLASKMLDTALAHWSDFYTIKSVAESFTVDVPGLSKKLIGEFDLVVNDGPDAFAQDSSVFSNQLTNRESTETALSLSPSRFRRS